MSLPDVKLAQLRHFVVVAELGSFNLAADKLARTQPAVSLSIKQLEHLIGGALFEKGNKARLTPLGEAFHPMAKAILERHERSIETVAAMAAGRSGRLRVAAVPSVATRLLPRMVRAFLARVPEARLAVLDDNAENVRRMVLEGSVDFGVASLADDHGGELVYREILKDPIGLVCPRSHPLARSPRLLTWRALEGTPLIRNGTTRLVTDPTVQRLAEEAQLSIFNVSSLLAFVESGVGVTTLPQLAFPQTKGKLVFRVIERPRVERSVGLISRPRESLLPVARAFHDFILRETTAP